MKINLSKHSLLRLKNSDSSYFFARNFMTKALLPQRILGKAPFSLQVSSVGFGCMGLSEAYYGKSDDDVSIKTIQHAYYKSRINLFDTADIYGKGANELLVGKAIKDFRKDITLATKFGLAPDPNNAAGRIVKANRDYVFSACEASLKRLGTDYIDLYYLHRVDSTIPIEETVSAMSDLVKQGKVKCIGLSEVNESLLKRAHAIHPISVVQTEYSLWSRTPAESIASVCKELDIGFVAYSPLGRGMLTGAVQDISQLEASDKRRNLPRFFRENIQQNLKLVSQLQDLALQKQVELPQLALAWLLHQGDHIVPIFGTRKSENIDKNVKAIDVQLTSDELHLIETILSNNPVAGDRYAADAMKRLPY